jgi:predicted nucleic acid-binding protein
MYTIDASVWVNAFDQQEAGHDVSRQLLQLLASRALPIVVPTLFLVEVAGAISRTRQDLEQARTFAAAPADPTNVTLVPVDEAVAIRALVLAAERGLRGADAIYGAVAVQAACTLVTRDSEHLTRLNGVVPIRTPEAVLNELTP